jgi:hypothetical protein
MQQAEKDSSNTKPSQAKPKEEEQHPYIGPIHSRLFHLNSPKITMPYCHLDFAFFASTPVVITVGSWCS